ncbi:MAG: hypothetical protein QFX37_06690 [Archaeoglobales archaeon]|nr:hypothetical protein [Archaeoglobales archaeon]
MAKEKQKDSSNEEKELVLNILEDNGKRSWFRRWKEHMAIPKNFKVESKNKLEQERVLRYLLLRVLLNQQAKFEKVREISIKISEEFGDDLLTKPFAISEIKLFKLFRDVAGEKGSSLYRVGALGGSQSHFLHIVLKLMRVL